MSPITIPTMFDLREISERASSLGQYPSLSAAARMRLSVGSETEPSRLNARDTVVCDTPASRATSCDVTFLIFIAPRSLGGPAAIHDQRGARHHR